MSNIIKSTFKDYNASTQFAEAIIENVNLYKKSQKIEVEITSINLVNIEELDKFEEYLKNKFQVGKVVLKIKYENNIEEIKEEDWEKLCKYFTLKYPITKAILKDSKLKIENNNITIILKTKNAHFMHSSEFDYILAELILNLYGKKYRIQYKEEINEEEVKKQKEYLKKEQERVCKQLTEEIETEDTDNVGADDSVRPDPGVGVGALDNPNSILPLILGRSDKIKEQTMKIADITLEYGKVSIEGEVVSAESKELRNGKILATFNLYDGTTTITCKSFLEKEKAESVLDRINKAKRLKILGNVQYDNFAKDIGIIANVIVEMPEIKKRIRKDAYEEKRVELHLHTQMSQMDGISSATSLIKRAASWGMKAVAITDHGVVQAFPEANKASKEYEDFKVIYGVEAYIVPDVEDEDSKISELDEYVVFDIETTGLAFRTEKITEIRSNKNKKWRNCWRI